jgi:spermidine synthase
VGLIGGLLPALLFVATARLPAASVGLSGAAVRPGAAGGHAGGAGDPAGDAHPQAPVRERYALKDLVSQVLTFDYLGALAVALAFPLLFVPHLG